MYLFPDFEDTFSEFVKQKVDSCVPQKPIPVKLQLVALDFPTKQQSNYVAMHLNCQKVT